VAGQVAQLAAMHELLLLAGAGLLAGGMNAIAGGGSFVSFPAMIAAGLPSVVANASSTVALFPGTLASTWAFRRGFAQPTAFRMWLMVPITLVGGFLGAVLLLATPTRLFDCVIPFLLLLATLTFAFGSRAGRALRRVVRPGPRAVLPLQFVISVYGGYFGGAVGLMMMAMWSLLTANPDLKSMAPVRVLLVSVTNGAAIAWFIATGAVRWPETLAMLIGSIIGGYLGARLTQFLSPRMVRGVVIALSAMVTVLFFWRAV
jgi:uncharacterized membrane protein YfcA